MEELRGPPRNSLAGNKNIIGGKAAREDAGHAFG